MTLRRTLRATADWGHSSSVPSAIMQVIRDESQLSRADVARRLDLAPATVTAQVQEFIRSGLVREAGRGRSTGGKPPTLLEIDATSRLVIAVQVTDHGARGALVDLNGVVVGEVIELQLDSPIVDRCSAVIEHLRASAGAPLLGVGVAVPGVVDEQGTVQQATPEGWKTTALRTELVSRFGLQTQVVNDADAIAVAEFAAISRSHGTESLVVVTIRSGIGAGLILDGALRVGDRFSAGEIGHLRVVWDGGNQCVCGRRGCLEAHASLTAIASAAGLSPDAPLDELVGELSGADRRTLLEEAGRHLGRAIGIIAELLDVSEYFLSGDVIRLGDAYLHAARDEAAISVLPELAERLNINWTNTADHGLLLGAANLVRVAELGFL